MTANDVKNLLGLTPHPREGGWYIRTWESTEMIPSATFADARYPTARRTSTAIYYLLEPDTFSEMHLLQSDELFHFYLGDPVEMLQLHPGGASKRVIIGNDLVAGHHPQVVVERGVWQGSRLIVNGEWALLGCTVTPGFEFEDYTQGRRDELVEDWPEDAELIRALTRPA